MARKRTFDDYVALGEYQFYGDVAAEINGVLPGDATAVLRSCCGAWLEYHVDGEHAAMMTICPQAPKRLRRRKGDNCSRWAPAEAVVSIALRAYRSDDWTQHDARGKLATLTPEAAAGLFLSAWGSEFGE